MPAICIAATVIFWLPQGALSLRWNTDEILLLFDQKSIIVTATTCRDIELGDMAMNSLIVRYAVSRLPKGGMRVAKLLSSIKSQKRVFRLCNAPSTRMQFNTKDVFQAQMAYGQYQPKLIKQIQNIARPGDRVLVAGGHIGYVPLIIANLGCEVIACEADPRNAATCRNNFNLNPHLNVSLIDCGLSDKSEIIPLWLSDVSSNSSFAIAHSAPANAHVNVKTGDEILASIGVLELDGLVLDVEGWELKALQGLKRTFAKKLPRWAVIECAPWALSGAGASEADLISAIDDLGWRISERIGNDLVCST